MVRPTEPVLIKMSETVRMAKLERVGEGAKRSDLPNRNVSVKELKTLRLDEGARVSQGV